MISTLSTQARIERNTFNPFHHLVNSLYLHWDYRYLYFYLEVCFISVLLARE
jgi:hypothetical protein